MWKKNGVFTIDLELDEEVRAINFTNSINTITLTQNKNDLNVFLHIDSCSADLLKDLMKVLTGTEVEINGPSGFSFFDQPGSARLVSVLDTIKKHIDITDIEEELRDYVSFSNTERTLTKYLLDLLKKNQLSAWLRSSDFQSAGYNNPIWELAEYCYKNMTLFSHIEGYHRGTILKILKSIDEQNPHFAEAQKRIEELEKLVEPTEDAYYAHIQAEFLKAYDNKDFHKAKQLFDLICNHKLNWNNNFHVKNMKDPEFLVVLTYVLREKFYEIKECKDKLTVPITLNTKKAISDENFSALPDEIREFVKKYGFKIANPYNYYPIQQETRELETEIDPVFFFLRWNKMWYKEALLNLPTDPRFTDEMRKELFEIINYLSADCTQPLNLREAILTKYSKEPEKSNTPRSILSIFSAYNDSQKDSKAYQKLPKEIQNFIDINKITIINYAGEFNRGLDEIFFWLTEGCDQSHYNIALRGINKDDRLSPKLKEELTSLISSLTKSGFSNLNSIIAPKQKEDTKSVIEYNQPSPPTKRM